jgi:hypothetical protein
MQSTQLLVEELQGIFQFGAIQAGKKLVVDRDKGIIKGVKIIGFNSQNGRRYLPEALKEAVPLYEGIKVNIDHPEKGPTQQRSSHDRFGKFINVRFVESEGIYGDLLYLKNHPLADSVCEAAEREEMNDVFGMSHNAQGEGTVDKNDIFVVSRITEVRHVDLVADPATTKSLTESQSPSEQETEEAAGNRVRYKSKRQAPGAKRKFVKAKSKGAKKPTGTLKESDDESEDAKEMHQMIMQILTKNDTPDDKKADEIVAILTGEAGDYDMEAQESVQEEAKVEETPVAESEEVKVEEGASAKMCEKCGAKMESMDEEKPDEDMSDEEEEKKAMKESIDPSAELAHYKTKDAIRTLCESNGVEFEESLVQDLGGLNPESLERQIKRIAAANLAAKPKCSPTQATFQESKEGGKKFPEGDSLFRWLAN